MSISPFSIGPVSSGYRGTHSAPILRYGEWYKCHFISKEFTDAGGSVVISGLDEEHIEDISDLNKFAKELVPRLDGICIENGDLRALKTRNIEITSFRGRDNIPTLTQEGIGYIGDIKVLFFLLGGTEGAKLVCRTNDICVYSESDRETDVDSSDLLGLPTYLGFRSLTDSRRLLFYHPGSMVAQEENRKLGYLLATSPNGLHRITNEPAEGYTYLNPLSAFQRLSKRELKNILDEDEKTLHYAVVLTRSSYRQSLGDGVPEERNKRFMELVLDYIDLIKLDVRGVWFDESRGKKRGHCNLHICSVLPPSHFSCLLETWHKKHGVKWYSRISDPITWRIYASRNHMMLVRNPSVYRDKADQKDNLRLFIGSLLEGDVLDIQGATKVISFPLYYDESFMWSRALIHSGLETDIQGTSEILERVTLAEVSPALQNPESEEDSEDEPEAPVWSRVQKASETSEEVLLEELTQISELTETLVGMNIALQDTKSEEISEDESEAPVWSRA